MSLRQIVMINRPFQSDNRLYASFFVEKWLREGKTMRLYLSLYENGNDIPFVIFTLEKAPNRPEVTILFNEDRDILGVYISSKDSALSVIEEIAKYVNVEEAFKLEIEEEVA